MTFVRNRWYAAAWLDELEKGPIRRVALGEALVVFKTENGAVSVLRDRCSHRAVPLSRGKVVGESIQCPYHGLLFDTQGTCIFNPHIKGKPETQKVHSYPSQTRYGAVWAWFGADEMASKTPLPDYSLFERGDLEIVRGSLHVQADYRLVIDNLLDLSHAEYLHPNTVGTVGASDTAQSNVVSGDEWVTVERKIFNLVPSVVFKPVWKKSERIDQQSNMTWRAPSNLLLDLAVTAPNEELDEDALRFPSAHILTPETEKTTHYFWASGRNFLRDSVEMSERVRRTINTAFGEEDRPIIESAQQNLDLIGADQRLANFTIGDAGAMRVRRILDQLTGSREVAAA